MSVKSVTADEFARLAPKTDTVAVRSAGSLVEANDSGRLVSYIFSDSSVGRDNHVIKRGTWDTSAFETNPVFLWAHDQSSPPIGKVVDISEIGGKLRGTVEYADADISPFADTIFRMVKGGYLNATSVSWLPREWKYSADRSRPGGIDFDKVELLEVSQVPVPALPTALATARAAGIDTGPTFAWAGAHAASRSQPIERAALAAISSAVRDDKQALRERIHRAGIALIGASEPDDERGLHERRLSERAVNGLRANAGMTLLNFDAERRAFRERKARAVWPSCA